MKNSLAWLPLASGMLVLVLSLGLVMVTVAMKSLTGTMPGSTQVVQTQAASQVATMALSPASETLTFDATKDYPVGIVLDSAGKKLDGVDVVINFDPAKVTIVGGKVNPSTMFPTFPLNSVDGIRGKIRFSALTFDPAPVVGIVGTFSFKPKGPGVVDFSFDFVPGSTTDSTMAEHGVAKNVLGNVTNVSYTFR